MGDGFLLLYKYRRILISTTIVDIKARYKGTILGLAWAMLYPILFLGIYSVIYLFIFRVRLPGYTEFEYVLMIFSGLIPFLGFADALGAGVGSVKSNTGLIKNTLFPIDLIPVKTVLTSSITMLMGLIILIAILWGRGVFFKSQLIVPVLLGLQIGFTFGLIWLLAALNVFFQDLSQMIGVIILFLMLISPIAYTQDMIPAAMMPLMYPNPLYYMITLYRGALILGEFSLSVFIVFSVISISTFMVGYYVFSRLKSIFADYV